MHDWGLVWDGEHAVDVGRVVGRVELDVFHDVFQLVYGRCERKREPALDVVGSRRALDIAEPPAEKGAVEAVIRSVPVAIPDNIPAHVGHRERRGAPVRSELEREGIGLVERVGRVLEASTIGPQRADVLPGKEELTNH